MFPQLVMKVKVVGNTLAIVFGWAIDGDACGLEFALVHFFTGSLVAAETAGVRETAKTIAVAITKVRFIMTKLYRSLGLLPLDSCWGFASNIQSDAVYFAHFVGNACGNLG